MESHPNTLDARHGGANPAGFAWLALAVVAALPMFWYGFEGLARSWAGISLRWPDFAFRFQMIVPVAALLLMLQVMRSVPPAEERGGGSWLGVAGMVAALLLAIFGTMLQIDHVVMVAMIGWVAALLVTCFGLKHAFWFWAPVGSLFLLLNPPPFIRIPFNRLLDTLAAELGMIPLRLMGVPVRLEGQFIDFGVHQQRIADVMASQNVFLMVLLACFAFATVYRGPLWSRVMPLMLAVPVLVLLAAVRIAILGAVVGGSGDAVGWVLRASDGLVFFGVAVLLLLLLVAAARRIAGERAPLRGRFDVDPLDALSQGRRILTIRPTTQLTVAAIATAVLAAAFLIGPSRAAVAVPREPFAAFPAEVAGWTGNRGTISDETAGVLNADDYVLIDYHHPDERVAVNLWSAFYHTQDRDKGGIHSPEVCLPLDGWNIVSVTPTEVVLPDTQMGRVTLNRAVIRKGDMTALVYYWFDGRGRRLAGEWQAKIYLKLDALTKRRTDGALVRYVTAILPDEPEAAADARLRRLMAATVDELPRFVPE